jgi:hypothetical protein
MFKQIRTSKASKVIACYLAIMLFVQLTQPMAAYALTEGPSQPEFNSFTPIGTSDMVDLASGDFNYNIPIMDVGGYPINLAYNSGVTMDQEASWVGLGWNLNIGQINRNVRGLPDDFKGDEMETINNIKTNVTVGINPYLNLQLIGALDRVKLGAGLDVSYNNYTGISAVPSFGPSFKLSEYASVGMQLSSSVENGASITPNVSISTKKIDKDVAGSQFSGSLSASVTYNSRQGLQSFNLSSSISKKTDSKDEKGNVSSGVNSRSGSGSISFLNNTFTPVKRTAFKNNSVRFSFSGGGDVFGLHGEISVSAYASVQKLANNIVNQKAYGYEHTDFGDQNALLDFNREKEIGVITKNTLVLPVTNYTYDLYSIQGQGLGGMFRPFRSQIGYLYDGTVVDQSASNSAGFEIEGGAGAHFGLNFRTTNTSSHTGLWNTRSIRFLKEKRVSNSWDYEKVFFKSIGETRVDQESELLSEKLGGNSPIALKLDVNKDAINTYMKKNMVLNESVLESVHTFNSQLKRNKRELRNQTIQKFTKEDVTKFGLQPYIEITNDNNFPIKNHHTAGILITDENGSRHIFGATAYNKEKREVTFNVGKRSNSLCYGNRVSDDRGVVTYNNTDATALNNKGRDHYFNSVKTPPFAHTYLLTSILSPDYSDITGDGLTDDDLGSYTKFEYEVKAPTYKWRVPVTKKPDSHNNACDYGEASYGEASYNEGLKTDELDQKGSYLYGVKELKYIKRIITKTHVAYFDLVERRDGLGVMDEKGHLNPTGNKMYRLRSIRLYSKPEVLMINGLDLLMNPDYSTPIKPVKTAHFEYDYSLCKGIDNNSGNPEYVNGQDINIDEGKLTLTKVYFTYRNSNMGRYTPYKFDYHYKNNPEYTPAEINEFNPNYHVKAYDIWGNYMPFINGSSDINSTSTTPQEFPYVQQDDKALQDQYASAWSLTQITLPSGGKIKIDYETDDYQYVQNRKAMQMFKVDGVTDNPTNYSTDNPNKKYLYDNVTNYDSKYIVIKLPQDLQSYTHQQIRRKYTDGLENKPIFFNFLLNMTNHAPDYDYVTGYFEMDGEAVVGESKEFLFIPMKKIDREGETGPGNTNPISVAGWFFGRNNLNAQVYGLDDPEGETPPNVIDIGLSIASNLGAMADIFKGPNGVLKNDQNCARQFKPAKSWIRLLEPNGSKLGGGCRVKKVLMYDEWDKMMSIPESSLDIDRYAKQYGQSYDYTLEDGTSSGVATYEPNISKENPFVEPFYHRPEKLSALNYQEKPFGESFFPSPTVTYSKVSVKNVNASGESSRTGKVVTSHYTSFDFPTITDFTSLDKSKIFQTNENDVIGNMLKGLLGVPIRVNTNLTLTQGFVIETNDMNGKQKKQEVFNQANSLISSVEYKYSVDENNPERLNNKLITINEKGKIENNHELATHFDVFNDFRESYNKTNSFGMAVNTDLIPLGIIPIIVGWASPELSTHTSILHSAVTTKVIHKSGILKEKIAFDLGSRVYTKNHAWDAKTGQVLLTETINEFDDKYYSFNFPAYWHHEEMGMLSTNSDLVGVFNWLTPETNTVTGDVYFKIFGLDSDIDLSKYLKPGDEVAVRNNQFRRLWVTGFNTPKNAVSLIKANGQKLTSFPSIGGFGQRIPYFRLIRPSYRNQQMASMASVTLMQNPIYDNSGNIRNDIAYSFTKTNSFDPKIINASAVEYNQNWNSQCENGLPQPELNGVNEYLFNIKGVWRPVKSYAYLTGRNSTSTTNTRNSGFFKSFNPFYKQAEPLSPWVKDYSNWTYASEITKFNPHGVEVENKDALGRYSSAQYGYEYKLPVAVSSNSAYSNMGFDGFEDYNSNNITQPSSVRPHFGFNEHINNNAFISNNISHSGKRSIRINPNNEIVLNRKLKACDTINNNSGNN